MPLPGVSFGNGALGIVLLRRTNELRFRFYTGIFIEVN
jgi:hypothetical protein